MKWNQSHKKLINSSVEIWNIYYSEMEKIKNTTRVHYQAIV